MRNTNIMNKLFLKGYLILSAYIILKCSSCSNEVTAVEAPDGFINEIKDTTYYSSQVSTTNYDFNYKNGSLKTISPDKAFKFEFVMDENKITEAKCIINNVAGDVNNISFDGINIKSIIQANNSEKIEFTHTTNHVLLSQRNFYSATSRSWILSTTKNFVFNAALNMDSQLSTDLQISNQALKSSYEFDAKNNVSTKMNPYLRYLLSFESISKFSANNIVK